MNVSVISVTCSMRSLQANFFFAQTYRKFSQPLPNQENGTKQNENVFSGSLADGEESFSDKFVSSLNL